MSTAHRAELATATSLDLACSDVFFLESTLRSDHFGSLQQLRRLAIDHCKIRTLPPRSFVGLASLETLSVETYNSEWSAILLHIDYEAFVGLNKLKTLTLSNNNIYETPAKLFCPLSSVETIDLRNNRLVNLEDLGLSTAGGVGSAGAEQCSVSVTKLELSGNRLTTLTPGSLGAATRLETLIVRDNEVSVLDRMTFHGLATLATVDLRWILNSCCSS